MAEKRADHVSRAVETLKRVDRSDGDPDLRVADALPPADHARASNARINAATRSTGNVLLNRSTAPLGSRFTIPS